jgi:hypothetical protein
MAAGRLNVNPVHSAHRGNLSVVAAVPEPPSSQSGDKPETAGNSIRPATEKGCPAERSSVQDHAPEFNVRLLTDLIEWR